MTDAIQVTTTTGSKEDAERIARHLVERRLAACVQVSGPISSSYRWQGAIESAEEWRCVVKTRRGLYDEVERAIRDAHPYETPEILAVAVTEASSDYLAWIERETG